jgi:hypothetical protein
MIPASKASCQQRTSYPVDLRIKLLPIHAPSQLRENDGVLVRVSLRGFS